LWLNVKVVAFEKFAFHSCGFESWPRLCLHLILFG
jgi:hypothetical protein